MTTPDTPDLEAAVGRLAYLVANPGAMLDAVCSTDDAMDRHSKDLSLVLGGIRGSLPNASRPSVPIQPVSGGGSGWLPFNVNDYVRVKLTEAGREALVKEHVALFRSLPEQPKYVPPQTDAEGWSKFQLWDLMHRLGAACFVGGPVPFETAIFIAQPGLAGNVGRQAEVTQEPSPEVKALREALERDLAAQLAASIAGLGFPVGMGIAPPEDMMMKAASGIIDIYAPRLAALAPQGGEG